MKITFDPAKRETTLKERGLDFRSATEVFGGLVIDIPDQRVDYGEERIRTVGLLSNRMVIVVWTPTTGGRRIISMRKANEREQARYRERLG